MASFKIYFWIATEPIDVEDFGHFASGFLHFQPVSDVVAGVVAEKRPGWKRIVHDFMAGIFGRRCGLRADSGTDKNTVLPVERFVNQRDANRTASAKNDGIDRHSGGIFPVRIDRRALASRNTKSNNNSRA